MNNSYVEIIKTALIFFPFIAIVISFPFILIQYHKFGSVSFFKSFILYSFVLYFLCAYFMVILPLPSIEYVSNLHTDTMQLIPFKFIIDFVNETSFNIAKPITYIKMLKESYFYVPIFNILLTIPFGVYLRYYFNTDIKKTALYSFLLSLFFELTQLTGLYFIYPRPYRLFDVDDLILNTLGGLVGYFLSASLVKRLPNREDINRKALIKGQEISGFRRFTGLSLDILISMIVFVINYIIFREKVNTIWLFVIIEVLYFVIVPYFMHGSTLMMKFLKMRIVDTNNNVSFIKIILRFILFNLFYIIIPAILTYYSVFYSFEISGVGRTEKIFIIILILLILMTYYFIVFIKYTFTKKRLNYEKLSKTKLISTIEIN